MRHFENYMFFTEVPASQFKQKFISYEIILLGKSLHLKLFAAWHGRGTVDEILMLL